MEASGFIALKSNELLKFGIKCECNNCTKLNPFVVCSALFCFANYCFVSSNANSHGSKTHIKERFSSADDFKLFCLSPIFCPSWLGACVLSTYHNALEHQSKRNRRKKRSTKKRQHKDILKKEQPLENEKWLFSFQSRKHIFSSLVPENRKKCAPKYCQMDYYFSWFNPIYYGMTLLRLFIVTWKNLQKKRRNIIIIVQRAWKEMIGFLWNYLLCDVLLP